MRKLLLLLREETDWGAVGKGAVYGAGIGVSMCAAGGAIVGGYVAYELRPPK